MEKRKALFTTLSLESLSTTLQSNLVCIVTEIIYSIEKEEHSQCQALFCWDQHKLRSNTQHPSNRTHHED